MCIFGKEDTIFVGEISVRPEGRADTSKGGVDSVEAINQSDVYDSFPFLLLPTRLVFFFFFFYIRSYNKVVLESRKTSITIIKILAKLVFFS